MYCTHKLECMYLCKQTCINKQVFIIFIIKLAEGLLGGGPLGHLWGVEIDGLVQGPALVDGDDISDLGIPEAAGQVHGQVLVPLLEPVVLSDIVEITTSYENGHVRLHLGDDPVSIGSMYEPCLASAGILKPRPGLQKNLEQMV